MADTMQETPHLREIDYNKIDFISVIGRGSYGTVYKARWQDQFVAIKGFECGMENDFKAIKTEIKQLSRAVHQNIIVFYGVSISYPRIYLVMEYAEGGSLHSFLHGSTKPYSASHAMSWARQCAEGVAYLHAMRPKPLIHRDLKPLNLLLVNKGRNLKICDFGTATVKSTLMSNNRGSPAWMAPEVFRHSSYTEKCDVFSWAIILWQIITREQPYKNFSNPLAILWYVNEGKRLQSIEGCPNQIESLMIACWDQEPDNRPSMDVVVEEMKKICDLFPGADEPLDYVSPHEQEEKYTSSEEEQPESSIQLSFENLPSNNSSLTLTNCSQMSQTTDAVNSEVTAKTEYNIKSPIFKGNELNTLSEEIESKWTVQNTDDKINYSNLPRANEIRNGMKNQHLPLEPLSVQVDPNAWELKHDYRQIFENTPKSEGKERLTVTEKKSGIPEDQNATIGVGDDTEKALHLMLDPELQPETPDPNSQLSQEIFQEHQKLAKEYLRIDTELYYATDRKEKILASMDPEEKQEKLTRIKKLMEKEELLGLYKDLEKQLEQIKAPTRNQVQDPQSSLKPSSPEKPPDQNENDWVFIP